MAARPRDSSTTTQPPNSARPARMSHLHFNTPRCTVAERIRFFAAVVLKAVRYEFSTELHETQPTEFLL
jgi:hypothetical protein